MRIHPKALRKYFWCPILSIVDNVFRYRDSRDYKEVNGLKILRQKSKHAGKITKGQREAGREEGSATESKFPRAGHKFVLFHHSTSLESQSKISTM